MAKAKPMAIVKADWNDADYVYKITKDISEEDIQRLKNLKKALKKYNDLETLRLKQEDADEETGAPFSPEEWEAIQDLLPYGYEGNSIHTIEDITIYDVTGSTNII